jgi:Flp pilus assembly protein TadD
MARLAGLSPASGVEPVRLIKWAVQSLNQERSSPFLHALGLAHFRAGEFDEAIKQLEKSNVLEANEKDWNDRAKGQNWLVLAMAHAKAGQPDEARRCLNQGRESAKVAAPPAPGKPCRLPAHDWGALQILLAEAKKVVEGKRANDPN